MKIMKLQFSIVLFSALVLHGLPAAADVTNGTILALDRKARTLVLVDRSAWALDTMEESLSVDLKAGDRIEINYESDEEGVAAIRSIRLLPPAKPTSGAADVSTGTVLVLDRKARILVLTDRTVWTLSVMKSDLPTGLKAGDRVEIDYESDEEGVSAINSITIM
jgi:cold shock CspA family protein